MFKFTTKLFLAASFLVLGGLSAANAQIVDGTAIKVSVPNAFVLRDKTFEAGVYTFERTPNRADSPSLLILRGENGTSMIFDTMTSGLANAAKSTQLVFDTVGNTTYLTGIIVKGGDSKSEIVKTNTQAKLMADSVSKRMYLTITNAAGL
jgi:hypothetical protein